MKSHSFISFLSFLAFTLLFACQSPQEKRPPNIIYIMADDLGFGDIGVYGQMIFQTPNIDRLAKEGLLFTDHYAGTSVCAPSRAVLMTGRHMGRVKIRGNRQGTPTGQWPLPASEITVAELLKQAGYVTGMIGKWGLGEPGTEGDPLSQGWDYFFGYTDQVLAHNYWPEYLWENGQKVFLRNKVQYLDTAAWHKGLGSVSTERIDYASDLFTEKALGFIDQHQNQPFLLYLPYTAPHDNGEAKKGDQIEAKDYGRYADRDWDSDTKAYAAIIEGLDAYVGQIREKIESLGLAENTLIFFTSDNGPLPERVGFTDFFNSNGPLRGGKRDLYEGGHRVPMVAWWPGNIRPGRTSSHLSGFQDFLPTACQLAGIPAPNGLDGLSYLPTLLDKKQPTHPYLYWEFQEAGGIQAVRKGDWKAVRVGVGNQAQPAWELYHLGQDLGETENLAEKHPEIVAELAELARQAHSHDPDWPLLLEEIKNAL